MFRPSVRSVAMSLRRGCDDHPPLRALLVVGALAVAGCSSAGETATSTTQAPAGGLVGSSTCVDDQGDATTPPADLQRASLTVDGDHLTVVWQATPPAGRNRSYYVQIGDYQLGVRKIDRGDWVETVGFAAELGAGQTDITPKVLPGDDQAQLDVPLSAIPGVTLPADWTATLTDNTADLDTCAGTWVGSVA